MEQRWQISGVTTTQLRAADPLQRCPTNVVTYHVSKVIFILHYLLFIGGLSSDT
jgi:hypothetical protein